MGDAGQVLDPLLARAYTRRADGSNARRRQSRRPRRCDRVAALGYDAS